MPKLKLNTYTFRILTFWGFVNLLSGFGTFVYYEFLTFRQFDGIDAVLLFTFSLLFLHLSYGASIALFGFLQHFFGGDTLSCRLRESELADIPLENVSVAVVIPIFNENPNEVYDRIARMYNELKKFNEQKSFDFFILSDSNDISVWLKEESEFISLLKNTNGWGRIYYRRRKSNTNGKSGNISDFCRRFGKNYRYMLVLDADSYMDAKGIILLTKKMESEPTLGILQTNPLIYKVKTSFQNIFKNSQSLYSEYYLAGANYWQMNSSSFWGHNAMIRLDPFIAHCALPKLPKFGAIGGKILSHDTIEAALIRRSGYSVRFSLDPIGSYEEYPPTWIESLQRDQRWCQGNIQHFWFLGAKELNMHSKISILLGIFSYLSSLMWLLFIFLSSYLYLSDLRFFRLAFNSQDFELIFKELYLQKAIQLQWITLSMLFVPKIIAFIIDLILPKRLGNSRLKTAKFFIIESFTSFLMAPTNMIMHVQFVIFTLFGKKVIWKNQNRNVNKILNLKTAFANFKIPFVFGILLSFGLYRLEMLLFFWLSPIWISWILSPFLAILTSKPIRNNFITPNNDKKLIENEIIQKDNALKLALTHPYFFGIHLFMVRERLLEKQKTKDSLRILSENLLRLGPKEISPNVISRILHNKTALLYFHNLYWKTLPNDRSPYWN
ncbi:MAG: glucans biosynthesis glucosyltransferase MdoH [Leptospira sp.]|nr:glucans biosynthesis glucosyltransferase MdoH [Leptospira sp.]